MMTQEPKRLTRTRNKAIAGVCGGVAKYFNVDITVIRIIFLVLLCCGGGGGILYLIAWLCMPEED